MKEVKDSGKADPAVKSRRPTYCYVCLAHQKQSSGREKNKTERTTSATKLN